MTQQDPNKAAAWLKIILFIGVPYLFVWGLARLALMLVPGEQNTYAFILIGGILLCAIVQTILLARNKKPGEKPAPLLGIVLLMLMLQIPSGVIAVKTYGGNNATLYIDNGFDDAVSFTINGTAHVVEAGSWKEIELPSGELTISYANKTITRELGSGEWIFNPDQRYEYFIEQLTYASYNDRSGDDNAGYTPLGNSDFFKAEADYVLEAPRSIRTKSSGDLKKTVIRHLRKSAEGE